MVFLFNRTIKNILSNYIPHEIIICDQVSRWINNRIKELINEKNDTFQCYVHSNRDSKLFKLSPKWIEFFNQSLQGKLLFSYLEKNDESFEQY